ncbi:DUF6146 domain-containing protein [Flavobacterium antarcticum]|uniref:DUF6146 family protein n=1 Tax=Flavobacterium antarcticum TaxID=271155 RepID=UPI0003B675AA|nr:DUF6146 family protein [Flavobacterium antarcticum]
MKKHFVIIVALFFAVACGTKKTTTFDTGTSKNDTIRIANDELEYEVIIIDAGFNGWLASYAKPRNYYTQNYMEQRNRLWVNQWNQNVISGPRRDLFEMTINYQSNIDYGYEVNYLLYNYLTYFQLTNNIQLGGFKARL